MGARRTDLLHADLRSPRKFSCRRYRCPPRGTCVARRELVASARSARAVHRPPHPHIFQTEPCIPSSRFIHLQKKETILQASFAASVTATQQRCQLKIWYLLSGCARRPRPLTGGVRQAFVQKPCESAPSRALDSHHPTGRRRPLRVCFPARVSGSLRAL